MTLEADLAVNLQEDATRLTSAERSNMVGQALKEMSSDFPREIVRDFTGTDAREYALVDGTTADPAVTGILSEWDRGVSSIRSLLHLIGDNWEPMDLEYWRVAESKFGVAVTEWLPALLLSEAIDSSTTLRVAFSKAWAEADPELNGRLYQAVLLLAVAYAHNAIAAEYAAMTDATLDADSVKQGDLSSRHMDLHDLNRKNYRKLIGLQQDDGSGATNALAASLQKDLVDYQPSYGGVSMRRGYNR